MTTLKPLASQPIQESVNYINYSIKDGLPSAETYDVFQDSKGFIWIGTDNGVVRFDGNKFETFTTQDGLTDNTIFKITEDHLGRIWFGTYNRKLCYYQNGKFTPYAFNAIIEKKLGTISFGQPITNIEITNENTVKIEFVWFASSPMPKIEIDSTGKFFENLDSKNISEIKQLMDDTNMVSLFFKLNGLLKDKKIGYNRLIHTYNFDRIRLFKEKGITIFGTNSGIYWYSAETNQITRHALSQYYITSFVKDHEGGLWLTTLYHGLLYVPTLAIHQFKLEPFRSGKIHGILPTKNNLIFSFNPDLGNYILQKKETQLCKLHIPLSKDMLLEKDLKEGLKFENQIYLFETPHDINSIIRLDDSKLIISSPAIKLAQIYSASKLPVIISELESTVKNDLYNYKWSYMPNEKTLIREYLPGYFYASQIINHDLSNPIKLFRASKNNIIISTLTGLYEMDVKTLKIKKSNLLGINNTTRIQDIIRADSSLLFATKGDGIIGLKNGKQFQIKIRTKKELNSINQLLYDSTRHSVYAATNFGIYQLIEINNVWNYTPIISTYDGLESPDIRQIRIVEDCIYYANNSGVGKVSLNDINTSATVPYLYINAIFVGAIIKPDGSFEIPYDSNSFDINFQAIGYKSQNDFIYSYRLNLQNSWRTTINSALTFNSLDPGDYNLQIKAKNVQGIESEIKQVRFNIAAPYWQSWWFISGGFLLCCALLTFIIYRIVLFYKKKTAIQRKLNELQVLSLQSKMSPHFIFNSLNSIQNYILTNNKLEANEYLIDFSKLIRTILKNSENSSILLAKELDILNMYVDLEKRRLRKPFKYNVEIKGSIDLTNCVIPSLLIQPYVENAIWHGQVYTNPVGEIRIQIERINSTLYFYISDNGIGIKKATSFKKKNNPEHQSIGTEVTKNRIELLAELNAQMSEVTTTEKHPEELDTGFVGTLIQFSIPYLLKNNSL